MRRKGNVMKGIKRTEFENGLVLLTERRPHAQKAVMLVGIKVGSINEDDKLNGASHYNEHLLFKSNKYRTAKQITEDLEFEGTSVNAFTDYTITAFYAKALPEKLTKAVDVVYQATTNFEYNEEEFSRERGVILTEIRLNIEQPTKYSIENLFVPTLFKGTPLERTIAGTEESMGIVSKEELEQFKKEFYLPNNTIIVVVGRFDEAELQRKVTDTFARLEPGKVSTQDLHVDLTNQRAEKFEGHKSIKQVYLDVGFKVPGFTHPDTHKLRLLNGILSAGMSSRMFQKLREERGIGYAIGSYFESFGDPGIFATYVAGFDSARFEEAEEVILNELKDLKTNAVPDRELEGTKNLLTSRHFDMLERIDSRAIEILEAECDKLPYDFREIPRYLDKITKEDLLEMAQKYLTDQHVLTALAPEGFQRK